MPARQVLGRGFPRQLLGELGKTVMVAPLFWGAGIWGTG